MLKKGKKLENNVEGERTYQKYLVLVLPGFEGVICSISRFFKKMQMHYVILICICIIAIYTHKYINTTILKV